MTRCTLCILILLLPLTLSPSLQADPVAEKVKTYWGARLLDLQAWPAQPRWSNDQLTFAGPAGATFTARCYTPPQGSELPPVLYLLDRAEPQAFAPGNSHAWVALDCRTLMQGYVSLTDPQRHPFAQATMLAWRVLSLMHTRSAGAASRIAIVGEGYGGGIALALAALCPHEVAFVAAHQPLTVAASHQAPRLSQYFDPLAFAPQITAPTLLSVGGRDRLACPDQIRGIHEQLAGKKQLLELDWANHCQPKDLKVWDQAWRDWANDLLA